MLRRKYLFPHVIEMNYQAGRRLGVNVYLIDGGSEFLLIDIGFEDTVDEIVELIRQMDFNLSTCKMIIATHADADHIQGLARAKELLKTKVAAHPLSVDAARDAATRSMTYATIKAQDIDIPMPPCKIDLTAQRGRHRSTVGDAEARGLAHARPHAGPAQLQDGQPALLRRQHLQGQLRRRHRRPPRLEHPRLHRSRCKRILDGRLASSCCPATARSSAATTASSRRRSTG